MIQDPNMSARISIALTLERCGYDPSCLSHSSRKLVVVVCPKCKKERSMKKQPANKREWCIKCRGKEKFNRFSESRRIYVNPQERKRANTFRYQHSTPVKYADKITLSNLKAVLRRGESKNGREGKIFQKLGHRKLDFLNHIKKRLREGCEICGESIDGKWDMIHRKPRCTARSLEELYRLYQLTNLAVAHPLCNQKAGAADLTILDVNF